MPTGVQRYTSVISPGVQRYFTVIGLQGFNVTSARDTTRKYDSPVKVSARPGRASRETTVSRCHGLESLVSLDAQMQTENTTRTQH